MTIRAQICRFHGNFSQLEKTIFRFHTYLVTIVDYLDICFLFQFTRRESTPFLINGLFHLQYATLCCLLTNFPALHANAIQFPLEFFAEENSVHFFRVLASTLRYTLADVRDFPKDVNNKN